ncbi:MAG: SH3 domain-containing protein [Clostridia bacterium]|nr:SH3 domain-containing protein [Clostridia bacterium]
MKATYIKGLSLLMALLMFLTLLVACNGSGNNPADSKENESAAATVTEKETEPPETEPAPLTEAEAKALLTAAFNASEAKTAYANTVTAKMTMEGTALMDMVIRETVSGNDLMLEAEFGEFKSAFTFVGNNVYISEDDGKYAVTLTDEQRTEALEIVRLSSLSEATDTSFLSSADVFVGLSGEKQADGSTLLTATDLNDETKILMSGDESMVVTIKTCKLTVNADGLLTGLVLAYNLTLPETDFSAAMSMDAEIAQTTVYDGVTVSAPADADTYVQESYEAVFEGTVPLNSLMAAAKMPLDSESYTIGDAESGADPQAQMDLLMQFPHLYADKSFTIRGTVVEEDDLLYFALGDGYLMLDYGEDVLGPLVGDVITVNAKFEKVLNGEDTDFFSYCFYFESYEIVERAKGPNGGTYMFVDVNSSLNVRPAPTTAGNSPITSLLRGEIVEVLEIVDGWAKIVFEDAESGYAYVSAQYLSES